MMPKSRLHAWLMQTAFSLTRLAPGVQAYFAQMKYKPKPFYRSGFLTGRTKSGVREIAGRMLPQPTVETADGRQFLLDACLGRECQVIAYGPDAQQRLEELTRIDPELSEVSPLAILPSIYNPDPASAVPWVRDVHSSLDLFLQSDATTLIFLRPDRYIAVATQAAVSDFVLTVRSLLQRYRNHPERMT